MTVTAPAAPPRERLYTGRFVRLCALVFCSAVSFQIMLPVLPLYLLDLGGQTWEIGLLAAGLSISALLARPFVGYAADRFGRRPLMVGGSGAYIVIGALFTLVQAVTPLLIVRTLQGFGLAAMGTGSSASVADAAPPTRRGEAMGIFGAAMNLGVAIGPFLGVVLADSRGYASVFVVSALFGVAGVLLSLSLPETAPALTGRRPTILGSLYSRAALYPAAIALFISSSWAAVTSFLPVIAKEEGIGNSGFFFLTYALTLVVTRIIAGGLSDRFGRLRVLAPGLIISSLGLVILALAGNIGLFMLAAVVYGVGFGSSHPALMALVADRVGRGSQGVAMSTFSAAFDLGIGGGAMIWGVVATLSDERGAFWAAALARG